jgi:hypothetical protein
MDQSETEQRMDAHCEKINANYEEMRADMNAYYEKMHAME